MTSPEPLRGAVPRGRPARVLGSDEIEALASAAEQDPDDEDELEDTGEWEMSE